MGFAVRAHSRQEGAQRYSHFYYTQSDTAWHPRHIQQGGQDETASNRRLRAFGGPWREFHHHGTRFPYGRGHII